MKKDLIEWGVIIALFCPCVVFTWTAAKGNVAVYAFMQCICTPAVLIISSVICRVMGWDK